MSKNKQPFLVSRISFGTVPSYIESSTRTEQILSKFTSQQQETDEKLEKK